ncbi:MAG: UDP-2,3-diacylglucosamine diphosphatase [Blastocatellia bacterium]|nr:UDP-2,3-diacylglucosamine diphosphatase [Blastocatellia bacterium]
MAHFSTIIISDVHLGSAVSRAECLTAMLKENTFERLLLLGDIFDDLNFNRLRKSHWEVLSVIRELTDPMTGVEVVWVEGNHDEGLSQVASHLIGVEVLQEYTWSDQGRNFLAIHGHQFDQFISNHAFITDVADGFYKFLQRLDREEQRLSRFAKKISKTWLRQSEKIAQQATEYGRQRGADYVFCGHTHHSIRTESNGVRYVNSGCWTDVPATFIGITPAAVNIYQFEN